MLFGVLDPLDYVVLLSQSKDLRWTTSMGHASAADLFDIHSVFSPFSLPFRRPETTSFCIDFWSLLGPLLGTMMDPFFLSSRPGAPKIYPSEYIFTFSPPKRGQKDVPGVQIISIINFSSIWHRFWYQKVMLSESEIILKIVVFYMKK